MVNLVSIYSISWKWPYVFSRDNTVALKLGYIWVVNVLLV